ncbi:MAG: glutamate--tRNA ligase [Fimbriiglobus sp.]
MTTIRTRFAPSPTGYLHIGGVRTALFNWLVAKRHGGQFILRIDDTDLGRNRPEAVQPIIDGFHWLGITWDEGPTDDAQGDFGPYSPYFQSRRNDGYVAAAKQLIASGHAYPDYMTKEEQTQDRVDKALKAFLAANPGASAGQIEKEKDAAAKGQRPYQFRGALRDASPADNLARYEAEPAPIRFKVPVNDKVIVRDLIRSRGKDNAPGEVEFETNGIGDPVILRGPDPTDGVCRPLYNFATVVDEIAMKVTHVVRAAEHFSNTPTQVLFYQALFYEALGGTVPTFAHVPVVNAPKSKEKLSKRKMAQFMTPEIIAKLRAVHAVPADWTDEQIKAHEMLNPATVEFYRVMGYLPEAVLNYLGKLGWSLDDKTEVIPLPDMIANFSLESVNESPASFDPDKLYWLAGEYMGKLPLKEKVDGCLPFLVRAGLIPSEAIEPAVRVKLEAVAQLAGDRIKLFTDMIQYAGPILRQDPDYDMKAVADKLKKPGIAERLAAYAETLKSLPFDGESIKASFGNFASAHNIKPKDLDSPLRVAITGVTVGFGLQDTMMLLGRDEVLRRLELAQKLAA